MPPDAQSKERVGDKVWKKAAAIGERLNRSEFLTSLRERVLQRTRYAFYTWSCYPIVVGFNRALIRSLSRLDNVRSAPLVKQLAVQLQEEQEHNDMWRAMMAAYGIDHAAVYTRLDDYLSAFSREALDSMTRDVIAAVTADSNNFSPRCFPNPVFPEPVLALYHHMYMLACDDSMTFWCQFGSQSAIEATVYVIGSESFYPGLRGNPELDLGLPSYQWWQEHAKGGHEGKGRSTEEKHLEIAKIRLNKAKEANAREGEILHAVDETLQLLCAAHMLQSM